MKPFYRVDGSGVWITQHSERFLYFPVDCRPGEVIVKDGTLITTSETKRRLS
jgi:hypothetical protein